MPESTAVVTAKRSKLAELLASIGDGTLETELGDAIVELTAHLTSVGQHGTKAKGEVNLKLKFTYDRTMMDVDYDFTVKEPKAVRPRTTLYVAPGGVLSRNNPQQMDAFSRDLPDGRPVRDVPLAVVPR
jgi:hypothetical protein